MRESKGFFITFEGIEGAGKSTHAARLFETLKEKGYPVVLTREPGGTPIGEKLRTIVTDPAHGEMAPLTELLLMAASRAQHLHQVIRPALGEGKIVISDRFTDATLAYQGYGREMHLAMVREVNEVAAWNCRPDITLLFDLEPYHAMSRVRDRRQIEEQLPDRLERQTMDFYDRVRKGYLDIAYEEPQRFRKFDAAQPLDVLWSQVFECVMREIARNWGDPDRLEMPGLTL
ncbi:MAG: dTMP kinase [Proteobacteria bacterium]|nr:dTMP kinase [Pseudomonadota bacterium]